MELKETVNEMLSPDYEERFRAEYYQLKIRYEKLKAMCEKWDKRKLEPKPACPRSYYDRQLFDMHDYLAVLEERALIEQIEL